MYMSPCVFACISPYRPSPAKHSVVPHLTGWELISLRQERASRCNAPSLRAHAWAPRVPPAPAHLNATGTGIITMACSSPGGDRAQGAGVRRAAAIAAATSSRMRPRTAVSDIAIGVAPVAVAGGGVAEREVPGSSTIETRDGLVPEGKTTKTTDRQSIEACCVSQQGTRQYPACQI